MNLEDIWHYFEGIPLVHLATIDDNDATQPRVRTMSIITKESELWLATLTSRDKVNQLRKNNKIEFNMNVHDKEKKNVGCIRVMGLGNIIEDMEAKKDLVSAIPFFNGYWKSYDDPEFAIIKIEPKEIFFMNPEEQNKRYTFTV